MRKSTYSFSITSRIPTRDKPSEEYRGHIVRNKFHHHRHNSPMASGQGSRGNNKQQSQYKFPESRDREYRNYNNDRYSPTLRQQPTRMRDVIGNSAQESYVPPKQSPYYSTRHSKQNQNPSFDKDFGPFGTVTQQDKSGGNDDINSMFRRPDYCPMPCSESPIAPQCNTTGERTSFRMSGVGTTPTRTPANSFAEQHDGGGNIRQRKSFGEQQQDGVVGNIRPRKSSYGEQQDGVVENIRSRKSSYGEQQDGVVENIRSRKSFGEQQQNGVVENTRPGNSFGEQQRGSGEYRERNSLRTGSFVEHEQDQLIIQQGQTNPLWETGEMTIIEEVHDRTFGALPPTNQQPVAPAGSRTVVGSRRSFKGDDLERILAKYGKGSRSSLTNNEYADKDPDFSNIHQESYRAIPGKNCEPVINNGVHGFWNNRCQDEFPKPFTGRRRRSTGLDKSIENLIQQMNNLSNNANSINSNSKSAASSNGSIVSEHGETGLSSNGISPRQEVPEKIEAVYTMEIAEQNGGITTHCPEFKRSTHVFPFKETPSGHLVVEPSQIAFESRKISVLVADPNNNATFEFSSNDGSYPGASGGNQNDRILHEVRKAMTGNSSITRSTSRLHYPPKEMNHKVYSGSKETTEEFQQSLLHRLATAKNADTHVVIGDKIYPCHSIALESLSTYFDRLIRPPENIQRVQLPESEVSAFAFPILMDWILQSKEGRNAILTKDNLIQVYTAARHLGMKDLEQQCVAFLEKNVDSSDPDLFCLWDEVKKRQSSCPELIRIIASKMSASYHDIYAARRFLQMDVDELYTLLSSDDISIDSEMDVYDSAVSWLLHDWKNRKVHTNKIMSTVRFGLLSPLQLTQISLCPEINKVKSEKDYNSILTYGTVKSMLDDGLAYSILDESYKTRPDELKKWVDKTGIKAPAPRTLLANKKRAKPLILDAINMLEDASQTKLRVSSNKIPEGAGLYNGMEDEIRPGTPPAPGRPPNPVVPNNASGPPSGPAFKTPFTFTEQSGNNKRTKENMQRNAVHEISGPKLLSNSSVMLTKVNSIPEELRERPTSAERGEAPRRASQMTNPDSFSAPGQEPRPNQNRSK